MENVTELKEIMKARAALYEYISALLTDPDIEQIKAYSKLVEALMTAIPETDGIYNELNKSLTSLTADQGDEMKIKRDFTALLCMGESAVGNCASIYYTPEHLIKREPWTLVRKFYAECGYEPLKQTGLEDSMSMELSFLAQQSVSASEKKEDINAIIDSVKLQKRFIAEHLDFWADDFL